MHANHEPSTESAGRPEAPEDVVTGFWLWVAALPLMMAGYVTAVVSAPQDTPAWIVNASTAVFAVNTTAIVVTLLILLRVGYRWARTLLTGGGAASVVYVATNVFGYDGPEPAAVVFAVTSIIGSVLIAGGIYLLHRKDTHDYFTR